MNAGNLTLWGRASSANVQKAVWALEELGLAYDRKDVGGRFGGLDTPEFGAMNPNRRVPVLQHADLTLWESHAIVRYLCATFGGETFWPGDPAKRALIDQWTDWTATTFQPAWIALFWLVVRTPEPERQADAIMDAHNQTIAAFRILEAQLQKHSFVAGDGLSYADFVAGASLYRWFTMEIERPAMPAVEAWYQRLLARPAFERAVCVSYEELRARKTY
ncbi:glutathione S-transferase family protein [Pelagibacterium halotolerans]|uniref:glutathione S-transferase family protein n=1 Tax=Pelagibacterium halotolerans TaxID=531813 RepID=UPI003851094E